MLYTVYKTTNLVNGKIYVGVHKTNNPNDSYLGSGKALKLAVAKYGQESFKKDILFEFSDREEAFSKESEIVTEKFTNREDTYNIKVGGFGGWHKREMTPELRIKLSTGKKGKPVSKSTRLKMSKSMTGLKKSESHRANMSKSKIGVKLPKGNLVKIDGVSYPSYNKAAKALGITVYQLRKNLQAK